MTVNELIERLQDEVADRPNVGDLPVVHFDDMDVSRSIDAIQVNQDDVILMNQDSDTVEDSD